MQMFLTTLIRAVVAVLIGGIIGSERARHGRAAGMRTHILVCLGACMTSLTGVYGAEVLGYSDDTFRLSAQVISGIGFLGAGMIILKNNNTITGLTTAAGVWTTATIGIALGYGYYIGAGVVSVLFLATIIFFTKFEGYKKSTEIIYVEVDDLYKVNEVIKNLESTIPESFSYQIFPPKSGCSGNVGISIVLDSRLEGDITNLCDIEHVVFAVDE